MKLFVMTALLFSFFAHADLEHREGQESKPTVENLSRSRGCFKEIKEQGCGHPRENQDFFSFCLQLKLESLTSDCQGFFSKLYGKRI